MLGVASAPTRPYGRVVSNFIVQALKGEPITIYDAGSQTRSFCYVDDLIDDFIRFMIAADVVARAIMRGVFHAADIAGHQSYATRWGAHLRGSG